MQSIQDIKFGNNLDICLRTIKSKNSRLIMSKYKFPKSSFYKMKREYKEDEKWSISGMLKKNSNCFL